MMTSLAAGDSDGDTAAGGPQGGAAGLSRRHAVRASRRGRARPPASGLVRLASGPAGAALPEAAFIFCAMHLSTTSARLSSGMAAEPFSAAIQHSSAARRWVIGGSTGLGACVVVPRPLVSHAASPAAASTTSRRRRETRACGDVMAPIPKLVQPPLERVAIWAAGRIYADYGAFRQLPGGSSFPLP